MLQAHFDSLWQKLDNDDKLNDWSEQLSSNLQQAVTPQNNGNLQRWLPQLEKICQLKPSDQAKLNQDLITVNTQNPLTDLQRQQFIEALQGLHPWRKGPFQINDVHIDTEWRSDWKWQRVAPHLGDLKGRKVLDIGCGSGYHLWRMLAEGAELAVGVDPGLLSMMQFLTLKHFIGEQAAAYFLPLTLEQLPVSKRGGAFDTVFSMGVLYHRRSPIDHIYDLKSQLLPGGELVLETLVIPDDYGQILVPDDRYAQMRNVWFLPTVKELQHWLERCGMLNVRCVDLNTTSIEEQRSTEWMTWNSLESFLDPNDHSKTIEGYPAPTRAVMICNSPK